MKMTATEIVKKVTHSIKHFVAAGTLLVVASSAWALSLQDAKSAGFVKEGSNGYLEVVATANEDAVSLVKDINVKRQSKYEEIAKRNNISIQAVEKQAAKKLMK